MDIVYLNGEITSLSTSWIAPDDRGFLLGDGLFETIHTYSNKIPFLQDHWTRLQRGANVLDLALPITITKLEEIIVDLLAANQLQNQEAILRLTITRGVAKRGLLPPPKTKPTILITAIPHYRTSNALSACIVDIKRNEYSPLIQIKTLNYLENILAKQQAHQHLADEAILLNIAGKVAETSSANIFLIADHKLLTPRLQDGALDGIIRKQILKLSKQIGIPAEETEISVAQLFAATEVFITNSVIEITPVIKINHKLVADGKTGIITQQLIHGLTLC